MTNSQEKDRKILTIIVILVSILIVAQTINNVVKAIQMSDNKKIVSTTRVEQLTVPKGIGSAISNGAGVARLCLNLPPIITNDCNLSNAVLNTTNIYNCTFNATDPNGDDVTFRSEWMTSPSMFNVTSGGYYNFSPLRAAMNQTNTLRIYAYDDSACSNNYTYRDMNMTVTGINRPPYLVRDLSNEQIVRNTYLLFYMTDYFADPDSDPLTYFYSMIGNTTRIRISGNAVEIRGLDCGTNTAYFVAVDPSGLTATSNTVTYEVTCPEITPATPRITSGGGGSGSGGSSRICEPDWRCGKWSECQPWNVSYKRCIDYNGCNPNKYEQFLFENCTYVASANYCEEKWDCSDWSTCENDVHTRMCIDLRTCGTNTSRPIESEKCGILPSCFNGIQDQNETGLDCGGQCAACRNIEKTKQTSNLSLIISIVGLLVIASIVYILKDKIVAGYKKLFIKKPRIKRKIYINNNQKEKLLQLINIIQARINEHKINHAIDESSVFVREYFKQLLSVENLNKQELITNIIKLKDKDLERLLVMFYAKITNMTHLRNKGVEIRESEIQALIDEMSHEIYLVAEFTDQEAIDSVKIRTTESKELLNIVYNKLSNVYIALKFGELPLAKKMYKDILKDYDQLSTKDKSIPYNDITRLYHAITYLETQYNKG